MLEIVKNNKKQSIIRRAPHSRKKEKKRISLTFDDGPDRYHTSRILDILKSANVRATFFVVGKNAIKYPELIKRIYTEGHDIGNHTFSHPVSPLLKFKNKKFIKEEIVKTNRVLESITGSKPYLFRPPLAFWDFNTSEFIKTAEACGHLPVGWTHSSMDWLGNKWMIRCNLLNGKKYDGDIMLLHDGAEKSLIKSRDATVETLSGIINQCKSNELEPLPLTELLRGE